MSVNELDSLCGDDGCRRKDGHSGDHDRYPTEVWGFFDAKDKNKLTKAGFATPRGGAKGAYQNHVRRSNQVIIPYERLPNANLTNFHDGYVVRLLPEQFFAAPKQPHDEFLDPSNTVRVGENAFVLYRSYQSYDSLPPMPEWRVRRLIKDGIEVDARGNGAVDDGHFVLRLPRLGPRPKRDEGPPQGIFAPEYAEVDDNYLCKSMLAWLSIRTSGSPYTTSQAGHLRAILRAEGLDAEDVLDHLGVFRYGITCCPLCLRFIRYVELHDTVSFEEESALENAAQQVAGATRSTIVNLFHLEPVVYGAQHHVAGKIAWGHAVCNTRLGQRRCYSLIELQEMDLKVGIVRESGIDTFGWISEDDLMIRSPGGAVWIQLHGEIADGPPPEESEIDQSDDAAT